MFKKITDINVLIVEDNEVNQIVLKRILQLNKITNFIVNNGEDALTALHNNTFDVILMDIQLPIKNGIETTIEIRQLKDSKINKIPIIALTANGLKGEEHKYQKAGMNGYLTKPFKENDLLNILHSVVINKSNSFNTKHTVNNSSTEKMYNLVQVYELVQGNEEFVKNLAQIYLDTIPSTAKEMVQEIEKQNWGMASKLAHKLKSTIDTMQIASIKEDIRAIEFNGKNATNTDSLLELGKNVERVINEVAVQLKEEFSL